MNQLSDLFPRISPQPIVPVNDHQSSVHEVEQQQYQTEIDIAQGSNSPDVPQELCNICFTECEKLNNILSCHQFCNSCMSSYLVDCIKNNKVLKIQCPQQNCKTHFTEQQIQRSVTEDQFKKYKAFYIRAELSADPNVLWCPKITCNGYVRKGYLSKVLSCDCGQKICVECKSAFHDGQTCLEAQDQTLLQAQKAYNIYPCPNCKVLIQKSNGCDFIVCGQCKKWLCWRCQSLMNCKHYTFGCSNVVLTTKQYWFKLLIAMLRTLFYVIIFLIFAPFAVLVSAFMYPLKYNYTDNEKTHKIIIRVVLSVILLPLTIPFMIIVGPYLFYESLSKA